MAYLFFVENNRTRSFALRSVLCIACGVLSSGCSFLFVKSPPDNVQKLPPKAPVECTTSKAAPVIDLLITGFQVFRTAYALGKTDDDYKGFPISRGADIAIGGGMTAAYGLSSIYGFVTTSDCEEAQAAHDALRKEREMFTESTTPSPRATPRRSTPASEQSSPSEATPTTDPTTSDGTPAD